MRRLSLLLSLAVFSLPLVGCGKSDDGASSDASSSTPAPTATTWAGDLTADQFGPGDGPSGETDTTITVGADGVLDFQTVGFGHIVKASGAEWYGGPSSAYLLRLTYNATAKTVEIKRISTGQVARWSLTAIPSGAG